MSTERDYDAELMSAISDVVDWLDYEVWFTCPGLEESVRKLRNARMAKLVHETRTKKEEGRLMAYVVYVNPDGLTIPQPDMSLDEDCITEGVFVCSNADLSGGPFVKLTLLESGRIYHIPSSRVFSRSSSQIRSRQSASLESLMPLNHRPSRRQMAANEIP